MTISLREIQGGEVIGDGNGEGSSDLQVYRCPNTKIEHSGERVFIARKEPKHEAICFVLNTGNKNIWVEHYLKLDEKVGERSRVLKPGEFIEFRPSALITNVLSATEWRSEKL